VLPRLPLVHASGQITASHYDRGLAEEMPAAKVDWAEYTDPAEKTRAMTKLNDVIDSLSPAVKDALHAEEKLLGLT